MGDRSNIYFRNGNHGVGVYGHWAGREAAKAAAFVLTSPAFKSRLGDASYATRIGVQTVLECLGASTKDEAGFGIWTSETGPDDNQWGIIVIDVQDGKAYVSKNWRNPPAESEVVDPDEVRLREAM